VGEEPIRQIGVLTGGRDFPGVHSVLVPDVARALGLLLGE